MMETVFAVLLVLAILSDIFSSRRQAKRARLLVEELKDDIARLLRQRELTKVEYKPGDVFVLQCKERFSCQGYFNLRESLKAQLGPDVKVLVVPHDFSFQIAEIAECS